MNLSPGNSILRLQITPRQHRQGRLKSAQPYFLANQILRRRDSRVGVHPHLRQAEQTTGKYRNCGEWHAAALSDQIVRQRQLADIELAFLEHALMAVLAMLERI